MTGIADFTTNTNEGRLEIAYDPQQVNLARITQAVKAAGFEVGTKAIIGVDKLHCASCVRFIEDELRSTTGVLNASLNISTQQATVEYLPEKTTLTQLAKAVETWGYKPLITTSAVPVDSQTEAHAREYHKLMKKFRFAATISIPVMLTAYYQFVPYLRDLSMDTLRVLWGVTALLTLPVMFWSGSAQKK